MTNAEYLLRFHKFQKSREAFYTPKINAALQHQYKQFTDNIHLGLNALDYIDDTQLVKVVRNIYMDAGIVYGAKIRSDLVKQGVIKRTAVKAYAGDDEPEFKARMPIGFSQQMADLIAEYFKEDIFDTCDEITETTKELIRKVFTHAYSEGLSIDDIVKKLEDTELSKIRARRIARTETVTAANQGAMFVAKNTGLPLRKYWLSAHDSRVRGSKPEDKGNHKIMDGQAVGIDDYFHLQNKVTILQPGGRTQENGKPVPKEEVINCRCCVIFRKVNGNVPARKSTPKFIPQQFVPATTIKEAKQFAADVFKNKFGFSNTVSVRADNSLTVEKFNIRIKQLNKLSNEYNITDAFDKEQELKVSFNSGKRYLGVVKTKANGTALVEANFGHLNDHSGQRKYDENATSLRLKSRVDDDNVQVSTLTHEFAHLMALTFQKQNQGFFKELAELKLAYNADLRKIYVKNNHTKELNELHLGRYADTNLNEFMAEGFTEYKLSSNPSPYALKIGKLIDKYFKR